MHTNIGGLRKIIFSAVGSGKNSKITALYFLLVFVMLFALFSPTFSNPQRGDTQEMYYTFHHLDQKPGPIKWLHVLNHDPYEQMRYQPLSHVFYYIFFLIFGSNFAIPNIINFLFYFLNLILLYIFSSYFVTNRMPRLIFITIFAFLFSHSDILMWNSHIYILIGFGAFLLGFISYFEFLKTGRKLLALFTVPFFLTGMWCYESFWLWPLAILFNPLSFNSRKDGNFNRPVFKINALILSLTYALYILGFLFTRSIGTYASPARELSLFFEFKRIALGAASVFFNILYSNVILNIFPLLSFPLRVEENIYMQGPLLSYMRKSGDMIVYFGGGLSLILLIALAFILRKRHSIQLKVFYFLFFLYFTSLFTVFLCRLVTNDFIYNFTEFRYQYVCNALVLLFLISIFDSFKRGIKQNKRTFLYLVLSSIFTLNINCITKIINIDNINLVNLKRVISGVKAGIKNGYINEDKKVYIDSDLPEYLPSLCWNIDMGEKFMTGSYQWLFSKGELRVFADNAKDAAWFIDNSNFRVVAKDSYSPEGIKTYANKGGRYMILGGHYLHKEDYNKAEKFLKKATLDPAYSSDAYVALGYFYKERVRIVDEEDAFQEALRKRPGYIKWYNDAIVSFEEAIKLNPAKPDAYIALGECYLHNKDYKLSEEMFKKALKNATGESRYAAYRGLGELFFNQKRYNDAIVSYEEAIKLEPAGPNAYIYVSLGYCYTELRSYKEARLAFENALGSSTDLEARIGLGWISIKGADYKQARLWFEEIINLDPKNTDGYMGMGCYYQGQKNYKKAEGFLLKAKSLDPNNFWAHLILGNIYQDQGMQKKADSAFWEAERINPVLFRSRMQRHN